MVVLYFAINKINKIENSREFANSLKREMPVEQKEVYPIDVTFMK